MDAREEREDHAEIVAAGKRATSAWGFLGHPAVPFCGVFLAVAGVIVAVAALSKGEREAAIFGGYDVICAGAACVLAWVVARRMVERALEREIAWLDALPFTIVRHFDVLAEGYATVRITFRSSHPSKDEWEKLLDDASGDVLALGHRHIEGRVFELSCKTVPALPGGHRIWRAWRDIVEKHFVPLHARHPFESIRAER